MGFFPSSPDYDIVNLFFIINYDYYFALFIIDVFF